MKNFSFITVLVLLAVGFSEQADAKMRGQRRGFNFGSTVRMTNSDDASVLTGNDGQKDSHTQTTTQAVSPFVGYAFEEFLNLGVMGYFEQGDTKGTTKNSAGDIETNVHTLNSVTGGEIFMRFLFAQVMFFEGGLGIYDQKIAVDTEKRNVAGTAFSGEKNSFDIHGVGPGYHVGGGIELPVVNSFYFTSTYLVRFYQLRNFDASTDTIGGQQSKQQRKELTFGLNYYYQ